MFYIFVWRLLKVYFFIFHRLVIRGRGNIPQTGGVVICSNHSSMMDPTILAMATRRQIHYVAKKELYKNKIVSLVIDGLGAYPVDRDNADTASYKRTLDYLNNGEIVGIFAQGSRFKELDIKDAKAGVALFALKTGAAVVPAGIVSTYKLFSKITLNYGPPVDLSAYRDKKIKTAVLNEMTEIIMNEVKNCLEAPRAASTENGK